MKSAISKLETRYFALLMEVVIHVIEKVFPFSQVVYAHKLLESNTTKGNLICRINQDFMALAQALYINMSAILWMNV